LIGDYDDDSSVGLVQNAVVLVSRSRTKEIETRYIYRSL